MKWPVPEGVSLCAGCNPLANSQFWKQQRFSEPFKKLVSNYYNMLVREGVVSPNQLFLSYYIYVHTYIIRTPALRLELTE